MPRAASVCLHQKVAAQSSCETMAACGRRSEHVVQADQMALDRVLAAGDQRRIDVHLEGVKRHRRVQESLAVRLSLRQR